MIGPRKKRGTATVRIDPMKEAQRGAAFQAGFDAFENGKDKTSNPYSEAHSLHESWSAGFDWAEC